MMTLYDVRCLVKAVIAQMRRTFIKLHTTFHMSESLKLHIIFSHYVEYFELLVKLATPSSNTQMK